MELSLWLFILAALHKASSVPCTNVSDFSVRLNTMLAEYDRDIAPGGRLDLRVLLSGEHVSLDERASTMRLVGQLQYQWRDPRLFWNVTEWGCDYSPVYSDRLWQPDVQLLNGDVTGGPTIEVPAQLSFNGTVSIQIHLDVTVPYSIDLTDWPNDRQTGHFTFGSRTMSSDDLAIRVEGGLTYDEWEGPWRGVNIEVNMSENDVFQFEKNFTLQFTVQREAPARFAATTAVFSAAICQLLAATLMPVEHRAALCGCAAFTACLWLISALVRLPPSSTTPTVLHLMSSLCAVSAILCACAPLSVRVARTRTVPPRMLRDLLTRVSAVVQLAPDEDQSSSKAESLAWAAAAKLLDYVLIVCVWLTIFVIVCVYIHCV